MFNSKNTPQQTIPQLPTVPDLSRFYGKIRQHQERIAQCRQEHSDDDEPSSLYSTSSISACVSGSSPTAAVKKRPPSLSSSMSSCDPARKSHKNRSTVYSTAVKQMRFSKASKKSTIESKTEVLHTKKAEANFADPAVEDDDDNEEGKNNEQETKSPESNSKNDVAAVDEASMRSAYAEMIRLDLLLQHSEERASLTRQERKQHKRAFQRHLDTIVKSASRKHTKEEADNLKKFIDATEKDEENENSTSSNDDEKEKSDDGRQALVPVDENNVLTGGDETIAANSGMSFDDEVVLHATKSANALQQTISGVSFSGKNNKLDFVQRNRLLNGKREKLLLTGQEERRLEEILHVNDDDETECGTADELLSRNAKALVIKQSETMKTEHQQSIFGTSTDLQKYVAFLDQKLAEYAETRKRSTTNGNVEASSNQSATTFSAFSLEKLDKNQNHTAMRYDEAFVRHRMREIDERLTALRRRPVPTLQEILQGSNTALIDDENLDTGDGQAPAQIQVELPDIVNDAEARATSTIQPLSVETAASRLQLSLRSSSLTQMTPLLEADVIEQLVNASRAEQLLQSHTEQPPQQQQLALRAALSDEQLQKLLEDPRASSVQLPLEEFRAVLANDDSNITVAQPSLEWPAWLTTAEEEENEALMPVVSKSTESSTNFVNQQQADDAVADELVQTVEQNEEEEDELEHIATQIDRLITQCTADDNSAKRNRRLRRTDELLSSRRQRRVSKRQRESPNGDNNGNNSDDGTQSSVSSDGTVICSDDILFS